jgi:hypothetical protein
MAGKDAVDALVEMLFRNGDPDWWEIVGIKCVIALEKRPDY